MTTNKPEVVAWYTPDSKLTLPVVAFNARSRYGQALIRLSDYEALQAELARELQRRFDGNEQASREHRADVTALVEALEDCITALEPYDDIKPRDWKTDRQNLRRVYQSARLALAAYRKGGDV